MHFKDLYCTKIVHISRVLRGADGHRRGQELAAIVPRSYYTRGIWARQEELAGTGGAAAQAVGEATGSLAGKVKTHSLRKTIRSAKNAL